MQGLKLLRQSSNYYFFIGFIALLFSLIFQGYNDFIWSFALPLFSILSAYYLYQSYEKCSERHFMIAMFCWSLFFRIVAVFLVYYILISYNGMPFLSFKDDYNYQNAAVEIMNRWHTKGFGLYNDLTFSADTYSGFPNFSAALMTLFGTSPFVPRIGNAVLSTITCLLAYTIVKEYADKTKAKFTCVLLVTLPLTITFSAMQFKDTLLLFFIVLGLYASVSIIKGRRIWLSVLLLVLSYIGCSFGRPAVIVPMAASLIIMVLRAFFAKRGQGNLIIKILSLIAVVYLMTYGYKMLAEMGFTDIDAYFEDRYQRLSGSDIQDSEAGVRSMSIAQYLGSPLYFFAGLFLPPPLLVSIEDTLNYAVWAVLAHYAFLPMLVIGMWYSFSRRKESPIAFFLLLVYVFLRIGQANSLLTSFSPRQSLATLFIMYLLLPLYENRNKKWEQLVIVMTILTMFAYNIVRLQSHELL